MCLALIYKIRFWIVGNQPVSSFCSAFLGVTSLMNHYHNQLHVSSYPFHSHNIMTFSITFSNLLLKAVSNIRSCKSGNSLKYSFQYYLSLKIFLLLLIYIHVLGSNFIRIMWTVYVSECKPTCGGSKITLLHLRASNIFFIYITYKRNKVINYSYHWDIEWGYNVTFQVD